MMKKRFICLLLVLTMSILSLAGCSKQKEEGTKKESGSGNSGQETTFGLTPFEETQELRIGFFAGSPLSIPWYIADEEGFFEEMNIEVVYETFTNGPAMIEANADWDVAGTGIGGALTAMIGYDIKTIGICDNEVNLGLFVREDGAIAKNPDSKEAWQGSTWLYPSGTTVQAVLAAKLDEVGLTLNDVNSVNMDISGALTALIGGEGDGLGVWNAIAFEAEDQGFIRVTDAGEMDIPAPCATYATDDAIADKKELVTAAYIIFYKTWEWCQENDDNFEKAVDYYLENCEEEGIACSEDIARRVMELYKCPTLDESITLMTEEVEDYAGQYEKRKLLAAENEFLYCLDFFISESKYTQADRDKLLDDELVDNTIAAAAKEMWENR